MMFSRSRLVPEVPGSAFKGFRYPPEVIVLAVRWYLRYGLSYRDVEELLVERGIEVDHVTVFGTVALGRRVPRGSEQRPVSGSDRAGEFAECVLDTPMSARVDTEFVVAATDVLHQRVTAHDHSR